MTQRDSNPWPLRRRCSALTNWAMKSHSGEQVNLLGSCFPVKGMSYERMLYAVRCISSFDFFICSAVSYLHLISYTALHITFFHKALLVQITLGKEWPFKLWNKDQFDSKNNWLYIKEAILCSNETNTVLALTTHFCPAYSSSTFSTIIWYKSNIPRLLSAFEFPSLQT